jgi:hypothetical protein
MCGHSKVRMSSPFLLAHLGHFPHAANWHPLLLAPEDQKHSGEC